MVVQTTGPAETAGSNKNVPKDAGTVALRATRPNRWRTECSSGEAIERSTCKRKLRNVSAGGQPMTTASRIQEDQRRMLLQRLACEAYRHGQFTLASGRESAHYVNCKPVSLSGTGLVLISSAMLECIDATATAVAGLTLGADPLVSGVAMAAAQAGRFLDALIVRKQAKGHGTGAWLEGPLPEPGAVVTVLEDVVTTGGSSLKAVHQLREAGYAVNRVITIVDREEGGQAAMAAADLELVSLFRLSEVSACAAELNR